MTSAPTDVPVKKAPLSAEQRQWIGKAVALIDQEKMRQLDLAITAIHSPTGKAGAVNQWMARHMRDIGMESIYQPMDELSGNAAGWKRGSSGGPSLMLYAPVDTHFEAVEEEDVPWVGPRLTAEMLPDAYIAPNGDVIGLGSSNPKGMVTTLTEAARCVIAAGIPLRGDLVLACADGGMPTQPPRDERHQNHGLGSGVTYMINHGVTADFCIISKPGWTVAWEEVGLCWFKVTVRGQLGYAGITRSIPGFRNSIVHSATVIQELDQWLIDYQQRNTSGLCSPQGAVAAVRAGWPHKPSFPSAATEIYIDVRQTPRQTPAEVRAEFAEGIEQIKKKHPHLNLDWEMYAAYPSASTNPESWVIQSTMRGWEFAEGKQHHARTGTSGQTDASAIRNLGIPTARVGFPPVPTVPPEWQGFGGMGVSHIPDLAKVTKAIIYAIVDTCTRTRAEVGLS
ncbi:MAG: acetylornithine deacetylase [SAR202 cluster bacterium]|nr:acetylornithine deacetylase [SAR202 cluster bacterium]